MIRNFCPSYPLLFLYNQKSPREELTSTTLTLFSTTLNPARRRDFHDLHPLGYDPHGDAPVGPSLLTIRATTLNPAWSPPPFAYDPPSNLLVNCKRDRRTLSALWPNTNVFWRGHRQRNRFWGRFSDLILGLHLGFNTATESLQAFQEHAETQVLALL